MPVHNSSKVSAPWSARVVGCILSGLTFSLSLYVCMYVFVGVYMYVCVSVYVCLRVCMWPGDLM